MNRTKKQKRQMLDHLIWLKVVDYYEIQSQMPGLRWTIVTPGQGQGMVYTSGELDAWMDGAVAGMRQGR